MREVEELYPNVGSYDLVAESRETAEAVFDVEKSILLNPERAVFGSELFKDTEEDSDEKVGTVEIWES